MLLLQRSSLAYLYDYTFMNDMVAQAHSFTRSSLFHHGSPHHQCSLDVFKQFSLFVSFAGCLKNQGLAQRYCRDNKLEEGRP